MDWLQRRRTPPVHPNGGADGTCQPKRAMAGSTVVEVAGSHAIYVSQPAAVAALIERAAYAVTPAQ